MRSAGARRRHAPTTAAPSRPQCRAAQAGLGSGQRRRRAPRLRRHENTRARPISACQAPSCRNRRRHRSSNSLAVTISMSGHLLRGCVRRQLPASRSAAAIPGTTRDEDAGPRARLTISTSERSEARTSPETSRTMRLPPSGQIDQQGGGLGKVGAQLARFERNPFGIATTHVDDGDRRGVVSDDDIGRLQQALRPRASAGPRPPARARPRRLRLVRRRSRRCRARRRASCRAALGIGRNAGLISADSASLS